MKKHYFISFYFRKVRKRTLAEHWLGEKKLLLYQWHEDYCRLPFHIGRRPDRVKSVCKLGRLVDHETISLQNS